MATITTIQSSDLIMDSRSVINTNFSNLNSDKFETSNIDTDTALTANSDTKVASQKATKAYVDTIGNVNASESVRGVVEEATDAEVTAGTATGATGAKLFVTPAKLATRLTSFQPTAVFSNGRTTRDMAVADNTQTIAHGLSRTPKRVRFSGTFVSGSGISGTLQGVWDASGQSCTALIINEGGSNATADENFSVASGIVLYQDSTEYVTGTVSVDSTNISIAWVKTNTPTGTWNILWEAES